MPVTPPGLAGGPGPLGAALTAFGAALLVLAAALLGYAAVLGAVALLALGLAGTWPVLARSRTPAATAAVLAVSAVAVVAASRSARLHWVAGAVALGIVLSFVHQIGRRTGREGLVLSLLATFGALALIASGALLAGLAHGPGGRDVVALTMASVVGAVIYDLVGILVGVLVAGEQSRGTSTPGTLAADRPAQRALLAAGAAALALAVAALLRPHLGDSLPLWQAVSLPVLAGLTSWAFRRVTSVPAALCGARGQAAAGIGSVLIVGALPRLFGLGS